MRLRRRQWSESTIALCIVGSAGTETAALPREQHLGKAAVAGSRNLDSDETTLLEWEVDSGCFGTAKDVRDCIEAQCGVKYTMLSVTA